MLPPKYFEWKNWKTTTYTEFSSFIELTVLIAACARLDLASCTDLAVPRKWDWSISAKENHRYVICLWTKLKYIIQAWCENYLLQDHFNWEGLSHDKGLMVDVCEYSHHHLHSNTVLKRAGHTWSLYVSHVQNRRMKYVGSWLH